MKNGFIGRFKNVTCKLCFCFDLNIIHKILLLLKNHPNYLKDIFPECFFNNFFFTTYNYGSLSFGEPKKINI